VSQVSAAQSRAAMLAVVVQRLTAIGARLTAIGWKDIAIERRRAAVASGVSDDSRWHVALERMVIMVGRRLTAMNEGWQCCDGEWLIRMGAELPRMGDWRILNEGWRHANGR
jgi:hypothetical protein